MKAVSNLAPILLLPSTVVSDFNKDRNSPLDFYQSDVFWLFMARWLLLSCLYWSVAVTDWVFRLSSPVPVKGTPSGSKRTHSRVSNLSVPNTSPSQTPSPTGVYRSQMPSPTGFANFSPPPNTVPNVMVDNWGFANFSQTPSIVRNLMVNNWGFTNMLTQTPIIPYVPLSQQPPSQKPTIQPTVQHSMQQPPSRQQAYELRDEKSSSGDDDDVIPETQPSPSPPLQPQPKRKSRKGKKAATSANPTTGKAPCKSWSVDEEVELVKAWAETLEDPTVENFWGTLKSSTLKSSFDTRMEYDPETRSIDAIMSKTKTLLSSVAEFACIYNNTLSGRYRNELHKTFPHEHAWKIVKECPKFNPVKMLSPTDIHAPNLKWSKTSKTDSPSESDARTYVNLDNDDETEETERPRPMGRNTARRAGSSSTTATSHESVTALLGELSAITASNNTLIDTLNERQRTTDLQFYISPHNHLSGGALEIVLQEKERIRQKYG